MNPNTKILVADDEESVRRSFTRALERPDWEVEAVNDGAQALQAMQRKPSDVVLLDLRMPGADGMAVLRALKRRWPDSEVVIVTGFPSIDSAKEAITLGACDYLAKPVGPEEIQDAATRAVTRKRWALRRGAAAATN